MRGGAALLALAAVVSVAGAAGSAPPASTPAVAVIAFADTGINAYHRAFRDPSPRAQQHPSTYIPGYPKDALPLRLTLDAVDYRAAVRADCERVWRQVRPRTLYWVPGTKIVGVISFHHITSVDCAGFPDQTPVLDDYFHGTMVASRGAANSYGACPDCRVVMAEGAREGFRWIAGNTGWIDVASHSWGASVPVWSPAPQPSVTTPVGTLTVGTHDSAFLREVEAAGRRQPTFWAAGNGVPFAGPVAPLPTLLDAGLTPSSISVGGHDSGYVTHWTNAPPRLAADACFAKAADHASLDLEPDTASGGTSGATPYVAGAAARAVLLARRVVGDTRTGVHDGVLARGRRAPGGPLADGILTQDELVRLLEATATPRPLGSDADGPRCPVDGFYPTSPVRYAELPADYPEFVHLGYGAVDPPAIERAAEVLRGRVPPPDRARTDGYFAVDRAARQAAYDAYTG